MPTATKINPGEWYSMQDIVSAKLFPWATSFWMVRSAVSADLKKDNILKAIIKGKGTGKKYHFKGENIIRFIKLIEAGKISL